MGNRFKRWRWGILGALVVIAGLAYALWPQATTVDLAQVSRGEMIVGITDDGVTRAHDVYIVRAPVTGTMARVEVEPGDSVAKGQVLTAMQGVPSAPLDPRSAAELRRALEAARASVAGATATLAQARRDLARTEELAARGFVSRSQAEAARTRVATGKAALAQAQGEMRRVEALLVGPSATPSGPAVAVRAPVSGAILAVVAQSAGVIPQGAEIMQIGDPALIEVVVDLLSRDAVQVKPGDRTIVTQWGNDQPLTGTVERIEPYGRLKVSALGIEEQRVNVIARFDPASRQRAARLGHGYQIDATIVLWQAQNVLRVPVGALFRDTAGQWSVFVAEQGRARQRKLTLGHINDSWGEVRQGLTGGEQVVLNPSGALSDGVRIRPR